jgi:hypothetical protein
VAIVVAGGVLAVISSALFARSSFFTETDRPVTQPVPFSHQHHVGDLGLDCRYCHTGVETSPVAGVPATEVCMTCHSQIWTNAAVLAPVRDSMKTGTPLDWQRVNAVGDFVYFNHAIHVNKGVGCTTCHGAIDEMPLTMRAHPMQMEWCLGCHRNPEASLRPDTAIFDPDWKPAGDIAAMRAVLMEQHDIKVDTMTDCYVCHR